MSQHGAAWPFVDTGPVITCAPAASTAYDDADGVAASETNSRPLGSKSNPNGGRPADADTVGAPAMPPVPTTYVSIVFVAFSVTTSAAPSGVKPTCAGPALPARGGRVAPASGGTPRRSKVKPLMLPLPPASRT